MEVTGGMCIPRRIKENIDEVEEVFEMAQSVKQITLDHLRSPNPPASPIKKALGLWEKSGGI